MAPRIVGLDFGRDTLRAVEVENADKPKPVVTRYHELPLPEGAVRSGEVREPDTVSTAIKQLWSAAGFTTKDVVLGMGNQRVIVRDLVVPKLGLVQIRESLPFQVEDMLPVPVADAVLDFYPVSESVTDRGPMVNGLLVAAIKESVLANVNAVRGAGLNAVQVDLIPFALARVLVGGGKVRGTVVLVDIGATTTNVVVATDGVPQFVRMIPFGGHTITEALATQLEVSPEQAESLKRARGLGSDPATSELDYASIEIIRNGALELVNSIRNTLYFFSSTRPTEVIGGVILGGGGARLSGFDAALGEMLRLEVTPADAFGSLSVGKSAKNATIDRGDLTVALGLALGSAA